MKKTDSPKSKELYERYGFLIYGRCLRILGSEDDARDALQEVFMLLVTHYDKIKDKEKVVPWLYTTAKNYCFNIIRFRKKFTHPDILDSIPSKETDCETALDTRQILTALLRGHGTKVRDAVYYTYIEKLDQVSIQKLTGQSPATIRRNLKRFKESVHKTSKRLGLQ
jgi:RNA polymerase sigma-70 factor (ECF subfamily)